MNAIKKNGILFSKINLGVENEAVLNYAVVQTGEVIHLLTVDQSLTGINPS
ncbi:MAG: hypothetical protein SH818_06875 [Saprospiraceae bacterium]|nr:hypothetical protein [Saprospiraceae bacterium]